MTRAEAAAAKLRQADDDRRAVEEWLDSAQKRVRCAATWRGPLGYRCLLYESKNAADKAVKLVFGHESKATLEGAYAEAAEWIRRQP